VRTRRKESLLLRACYAAFYRVAASLADVALPVGSGDFSLISRRAVEHMRTAEERHRYLRGLRTWVGFKQTGIEDERADRGGGDGGGRFEVRLARAVSPRLRRHLRVLGGADPPGDYRGSGRDRAHLRVLAVCDRREAALQSVAAGLHRALPRHGLPLWRAAA